MIKFMIHDSSIMSQHCKTIKIQNNLPWLISSPFELISLKSATDAASPCSASTAADGGGGPGGSGADGGGGGGGGMLVLTGAVGGLSGRGGGVCPKGFSGRGGTSGRSRCLGRRVLSWNMPYINSFIYNFWIEVLDLSFTFTFQARPVVWFFLMKLINSFNAPSKSFVHWTWSSSFPKKKNKIEYLK